MIFDHPVSPETVRADNDDGGDEPATTGQFRRFRERVREVRLAIVARQEAFHRLEPQVRGASLGFVRDLMEGLEQIKEQVTGVAVAHDSRLDE